MKATDYYPYNLELTIENLQYALSYDPEHPQALCLLGQIYMYHLKEYDNAKRCFQQSIAANGNYPDNYRLLSILHIWLGEFSQAGRMLDFACKRPGQSKDALLRIKAMMWEYQGDFAKAKLLLKQAKLISQQCEAISQIENDISRLRKKQKRMKKAIKKSRKIAKY